MQPAQAVILLTFADSTRTGRGERPLENSRRGSVLAVVAAYMASYDVSTNPMAAAGEKMNSVQNRRRTQVEEWWHSSAGEAEQLHVANKWSAGVKPNVLQQTLQVNSGAAAESVGGEGKGGKAYT